MLGNVHNEVLQCFIRCLLLLMKIRTDAPGLRCYIYSPNVHEEWELHTSLVSYTSQVYALLITKQRSWKIKIFFITTKAIALRKVKAISCHRSNVAINFHDIMKHSFSKIDHDFFLHDSVRFTVEVSTQKVTSR